MYEYDTSEIPHREPIIDLLPEDLDFKWGILSKAILENIKKSPELGKQISSMDPGNLSENAAWFFLNSNLVFNKTVTGLLKRYNDSLINVLSLDEVPKEQIPGNISDVQEMFDLKKTILHIKNSDYYPDEKDDEDSHITTKDDKMARMISSESFTRGITEGEKELLIKRYIYARETNLLSLGASILATKEDLSQEDIALENGIQIRKNLAFDKQIEEILNPINWENRKKIKDRVFEINIDGEVYILKEKKTRFHTDAINTGRESLSSFEEFEIAKDLHLHGSIDNSFISVGFEEPITSVLFPNGYQFTIFKKSDIFEESKNGLDILGNIQANPQQFEEEYNYVLENYHKFKKNSDVTLYSKRYKIGFFKKLFSSEKEEPITFNDFSYILAGSIYRKTYNTYKNIFRTLGYVNIDSNPNNEQIVVGTEEGFGIKVFGYDFEYIEQIDNPGESPNIAYTSLSDAMYDPTMHTTAAENYYSSYLALEEFEKMRLS